MEALIIVDLQRDFCKNGSLEIKDADTIVSSINKLINKFISEGKKIIATMDWHPENHSYFIKNNSQSKEGYWPPHCVQNTYGAKLHPDLILTIDKIIYKGTDEKIDSYSGFFDNERKMETDLRTYLEHEKIEKIYIVGLATDYCVKYTVLDALSLGYEVDVIIDCCKAVNLNEDDEKKAIDEMKIKGAKMVESHNFF